MGEVTIGNVVTWTIALVGAFSGLEGLKYLLNLRSKRRSEKAAAEKEEISVNSADIKTKKEEFDLWKAQIDYLQGRLDQRDIKLDFVYKEKKDAEKLNLKVMEDNSILRLKAQEAEQWRCNIVDCKNRVPPKDYLTLKDVEKDMAETGYVTIDNYKQEKNETEMNKWDVRLSKNFKLSEFAKSARAEKEGINNAMDFEQASALYNLVNKLLQPLRDKWGKAIVISSGYRNEEVNRLVGGVPTSQHRKGEAADCVSGDAHEFFNFIQNSGLEFDQIILYTAENFVHISLNSDGHNRKQVLINN